jgi:hypothetical protein
MLLKFWRPLHLARKVWAGSEGDVRLRLGRAGVSAASGLAPDLMVLTAPAVAVSSGHVAALSGFHAVVGDVVWQFPVTVAVVGALWHSKSHVWGHAPHLAASHAPARRL